MPVSLLRCWISRWETFFFITTQLMRKRQISKDLKDKKNVFILCSSFVCYSRLLIPVCRFTVLTFLAFVLCICWRVYRQVFVFSSICMFIFFAVLILKWKVIFSSFIQSILKTHLGISILFSVQISSSGKTRQLLFKKKRLNCVLSYDTQTFYQIIPVFSSKEIVFNSYTKYLWHINGTQGTFKL